MGILKILKILGKILAIILVFIFILSIIPGFITGGPGFILPVEFHIKNTERTIQPILSSGTSLSEVKEFLDKKKIHYKVGSFDYCREVLREIYKKAGGGRKIDIDWFRCLIYPVPENSPEYCSDITKDLKSYPYPVPGEIFKGVEETVNYLHNTEGCRNIPVVYVDMLPRYIQGTVWITIFLDNGNKVEGHHSSYTGPAW